MAVLRGTISLVVLAALGIAALVYASPIPSTSTITVRWLLAHKPTALYEQAVQVFASELEKESNGTMKVQVLTPDDVDAVSDVAGVKNDEVMRLLDEGTIDMSSSIVVGLATEDPQLLTTTLPFLFSDLRTALAELDGAFGSTLLTHFTDSTDMRGLGFTLSGGLRIFAHANAPFTSIEDFKGKRIATTGGSIAEATLRALGAEPISLNAEDGGDGMQHGTIDAVETTYTRLSELGSNQVFTKAITETNHSLFLTMMITSDRFFDSLTHEQQDALMKAARAAALVEREDSIALGEATKQSLLRDGVVIAVPNDEMQSAMRARTADLLETGKTSDTNN